MLEQTLKVKQEIIGKGDKHKQKRENCRKIKAPTLS
jgi:hypothetical protein